MTREMNEQERLLKRIRAQFPSDEAFEKFKQDIRQNVPKMLAVSDTIVRAYISAGCPLGSDDVARWVLVWVGKGDPGPSPDQMTISEYMKECAKWEGEQTLTGRREQ